MTKYKKVFEEMLSQNELAFSAFKEVHDAYAMDPDSHRSQFNEEGEKVMEIIRRYENRLCRHTENVGYGLYSSSLADKFWTEVREYLPKIDEVGTLS